MDNYRGNDNGNAGGGYNLNTGNTTGNNYGSNTNYDNYGSNTNDYNSNYNSNYGNTTDYNNYNNNYNNTAGNYNTSTDNQGINLDKDYGSSSNYNDSNYNNANYNNSNYGTNYGNTAGGYNNTNYGNTNYGNTNYGNTNYGTNYNSATPGAGNFSSSYNNYSATNNMNNAHPAKVLPFKLPRLKSIIILSIIIGVIVFITKGNNRSKAEWAAEQNLMKAACDMIENPHAYTAGDVVDILNRMIEEDAEDFYMDVETSISKDDIKEAAQQIDPFLGRLTLFSYVTSSSQDGDGPVVHDATAGVNFTFERSIESYVYNDIKKGIPIPADNIQASKVKAECESFLKEYIKPGMTDYEKEVAVHDYIVGNCTYDKSNLDDETIYSSYGVLVNRKAVCEGYARTSALLLKLSGVESDLISGDAKGDMVEEGSTMGHMWNQVCIDGVWYNYDATWDDPSGDSETLAHLYLNVSDQILALDHEWDLSKSHSCNSMDQNYYKKEGMFFSDDASFQQYVKDQLAAGERSCIKCSITDLDLSEDTMSFIFSYDGISSYQFMTIGIDGYKYLEIRINV